MKTIKETEVSTLWWGGFGYPQYSYTVVESSASEEDLAIALTIAEEGFCKKWEHPVAWNLQHEIYAAGKESVSQKMRDEMLQSISSPQMRDKLSDYWKSFI